MRPLTAYLTSVFIAAHGLVYFAIPLTSLSDTAFQAWKGTSVLIGTTLGVDALKSITIWLWTLCGIGFITVAVAIVFRSKVPGVWRPLAIGAAIVSMVSFAIFWDGQANQLVNDGAIGLIISLAIGIGAIIRPKTF